MPDIAGLKLIIPTSVSGTGVSVSSTGKVTFTNASILSVNGAFSNIYDNYLIVFRGKANVGYSNQFFRFRSNGVDNSSATCQRQYMEVNGSGTSSLRQSVGASWGNALYASFTPEYSGTHLYIYGPFLTQPTAGRCIHMSADAGAYILDSAYTDNSSTAYDGFTINTSNDTITGMLTIYGFSK